MNSIKIDGKKNKKQDVEERVAQEVVLEQAALMDTQSTPAVEVLPQDRDVVQENPVKLVHEAEEANDLHIPQVVSANLPKAKKARAQSGSKKMVAENVAKDEWNLFLTEYMERQRVLNQTLMDVQRDLTKFRGEAAPGQTQHVVPDRPSFYKPDVVQPEEIALRANPIARQEIVDLIEPDVPVTRKRRDSYGEDRLQEMSRDKRMKKGVEDAPVHFENRAVRDRALQYMSGNGATPSERDAYVSSALSYWNGF